jgi:cytoskeletal protein CcmA (bactofilin family)
MADTSTIVGQTIVINGNLEGDEDLTVQGRIEGSINLTRTIIIEPSGAVKAEVSVNNAIVSGVMVGNLTATDSVEVTETGRMVGDISAPRVIIVEGALFKGKVDMGDLEMPRPATQDRPTPARTSTYRPEPLPRPVAAPVKREAPKPAPTPAPAPAPAPAPVKKPEPATPVKKAVAAKAGGGRTTKKKVVVKKKR